MVGRRSKHTDNGYERATGKDKRATCCGGRAAGECRRTTAAGLRATAASVRANARWQPHLLGVFLAAALFGLSACAAQPVSLQAKDLMANVSTVGENRTVCLSEGEWEGACDYAANLFAQCVHADQEGNVIVSPLSTLFALGMTANGASGQTLEQMEATLGGTCEVANGFLADYLDLLPTSEGCTVNLANSIWLKECDDLQVRESFLETNANFYHAGVFSAPFDSSTVKDINNWVSLNTEGRITDLLDGIPDEALLYLVNALSFDGEWLYPYKSNQVYDATFTAQDGQRQDVRMMTSMESTYVELENAVGFAKPYKGSTCSFLALLPDEGVSVDELAASLSGETVLRMLDDAQEVDVEASIPQFSGAYDVELSEALESMGMVDAFDEDAADFSAMGTTSIGNLYIGRVLHKCFVAVDEEGTEAAAATAVEMASESAAEVVVNSKIVRLDRPFVYFIVAEGVDVPLFMGVVRSIA